VISGFGFQIRGYLFVSLTACLWGTLGIFFRVLHDPFGLPALTIAFLRAGVAVLILFPALLLVRPRLLRIPRGALAFFATYGFCGVAAFYFFFTQSVIQTSVTTGAVLLYTAPAFVSLIAWRLWGEPLNARKLAAIALAFVGCALVARAYDIAQLRLNGVGLALGVGAGLTYGLYSLFSKRALKDFSAWTALAYALLFGALFLLPLQSRDGFAPLTQEPRAWLLVLGMAIGPTIGALALYNAGLARVPASNASIVATIEPVVAAVLSFAILGERLEFLQIVGGGLVIGGALWLSLARA
jgi:drug/metabolite transporter (DMT)-like permease